MTDAARKTVLVIDDDPFMRAFAATALDKAGFQTRQAENAVEGVASALTSPPDLILLDYAMPTNDGLEVIGALKLVRDAAETPVIVLSAWQSEDVKARFMAMGASWLDKPVSVETLVSAVKRRLTP